MSSRNASGSSIDPSSMSLGHALGDVGDPCGTTNPYSPSRPRSGSPARFVLSRSLWRTRCSARNAYCSTFLIGTKRIGGRAIASPIASASAASFLLLFTYGLTNCGAMRRAVRPIDSSLHAQWWALEHASMPTRLREEERGDLIAPQQVLDQIEADCRTLHGGRFFRCAAPATNLRGQRTPVCAARGQNSAALCFDQ